MSKDYPLAYNATLLFQIRYSYLYPRRRINNTVLSYVLYDKCAIIAESLSMQGEVNWSETLALLERDETMLMSCECQHC